MKDHLFSSHSLERLKERSISEEWVKNTIMNPDFIEQRDDGNTHNFKAIIEREYRYLHVIVNEEKNPPLIVSAFFDKKYGRKQ